MAANEVKWPSSEAFPQGYRKWRICKSPNSEYWQSSRSNEINFSDANASKTPVTFAKAKLSHRGCSRSQLGADEALVALDRARTKLRAVPARVTAPAGRGAACELLSLSAGLRRSHTRLFSCVSVCLSVRPRLSVGCHRSHTRLRPRVFWQQHPPHSKQPRNKASSAVWPQ